jgi:hypothetical protein
VRERCLPVGVVVCPKNARGRSLSAQKIHIYAYRPAQGGLYGGRRQCQTDGRGAPAGISFPFSSFRRRSARGRPDACCLVVTKDFRAAATKCLGGAARLAGCTFRPVDLSIKMIFGLYYELGGINRV